MLRTEVVRTIGREIAAFLLAATCAGCDAPGELLCAPCLRALAARPRTVHTAAGMPVQAALEFEGVAARCIRRLKESGETHLARPLGGALADVLGREAHGRLVVPVPTGRVAHRRRGYRVPEMLVSRAGETPTRLLTASGRIADQRTLGRRGRAENVRGSMRARAVGQEEVVLVDDVVTTGATLDEAGRALSDAGFRVVAAIALATTPRHSRDVGDADPTRRK